LLSRYDPIFLFFYFLLSRYDPIFLFFYFLFSRYDPIFLFFYFLLSRYDLQCLLYIIYNTLFCLFTVHDALQSFSSRGLAWFW